jgi:hypothetical protein
LARVAQPGSRFTGPSLIIFLAEHGARWHVPR